MNNLIQIAEHCSFVVGLGQCVESCCTQRTPWADSKAFSPLLFASRRFWSGAKMNLWVNIRSSKVILKASLTVKLLVLLLCGHTKVAVWNAVSTTWYLLSDFPSFLTLTSVPDMNEEPLPVLTPEEMAAQRRQKLQERKMHIAALASAILSEPDSNVGTFT